MVIFMMCVSGILALSGLYHLLFPIRWIWKAQARAHRWQGIVNSEMTKAWARWTRVKGLLFLILSPFPYWIVYSLQQWILEVPTYRM